MGEAAIPATVQWSGPNPYALAALLAKRPVPFEVVEAPRVEILPPTSRALVERSEEPLSLEELMAAWFAQLSKATIRVYKQDLLAFARFLGVAEGEGPDERRRAVVLEILGWSKLYADRQVMRWLADMDELGLATNTRSRRITTLRSVTAQAHEFQLIDWRLTMKAPKPEAFLDTRGPTEEEVLRLLECAGEGREGLRNRAILALLCIRGLRRIEVQELDREHFDRPGPRVHVRFKGKKESDRRWVSLPVQVGEAIGRWVDVEEIVEPKAPLFHGLQRRGKRLNLSGINKIVRKIGARAGVEVWPHALRHSGVTLAAEVTGGDVRAAQQFARHTSVQNTMRYIDQWEDLGGKASEKIAARLLGKDDA